MSPRRIDGWERPDKARQLGAKKLTQPQPPSGDGNRVSGCLIALVSLLGRWL